MTEILEKKDLISKSFILNNEEVMSDFEWHFVDTTKLQNILKSMLEGIKEAEAKTTEYCVKNHRHLVKEEGVVLCNVCYMICTTHQKDMFTIKSYFKPLLAEEEMIWTTIVGEDIPEEEM